MRQIPSHRMIRQDAVLRVKRHPCLYATLAIHFQQWQALPNDDSPSLLLWMLWQSSESTSYTKYLSKVVLQLSNFCQASTRLTHKTWATWRRECLWKWREESWAMKNTWNASFRTAKPSTGWQRWFMKRNWGSTLVKNCSLLSLVFCLIKVHTNTNSSQARYHRFYLFPHLKESTSNPRWSDTCATTNTHTQPNWWKVHGIAGASIPFWESHQATMTRTMMC